MSFMISPLDFSKRDGFVIVVAQDAHTGAVLMVARADREAIERTIAPCRIAISGMRQ